MEIKTASRVRQTMCSVCSVCSACSGCVAPVAGGRAKVAACTVS